MLLHGHAPTSVGVTVTYMLLLQSVCVCARVCNAGHACLVSCDLKCLYKLLLLSFSIRGVTTWMQFIFELCTACRLCLYVIGSRDINTSLLLL